MNRRVLLVIVLAVVASRVGESAPVFAQSSTGASDTIAQRLTLAAQAMQEAEYERAAQLSGPVARSAITVSRDDRAEAWRIHGLALFFLGHRVRAEAAIFEYLKLDTDAHLDPSLVPPEAIVFFEDVRARHAAALRRYQPRATAKKRMLLNLIPPAGQFQNGDAKKGWAIGVSGALLLTSNLTSYWLLNRYCTTTSQECTKGGRDRGETGESLRTMNLVTGWLLIATYTYGVLDGVMTFRRDRSRVDLMPAPGGGAFTFSADF